jgi:hypothetical protein
MTNGTNDPEVSDLETVFFVTAQRLQPGEVTLHKAPAARVTRRLEEVKGDWERIVKQIAEMVSGTQTNVAETGFDLKDLTVGLAFSASGKLGFIAEAGVEASITVTFARR